jgi:hypothetical protein
MAASKRSASRTRSKKRSRTAKKSSAAAKSTRKTGKRRSSRKSSGVKKKAQKPLRRARGALKRVGQAGAKTWKALKATTSEAVERLGERWGDESERDRGSH